MNLPICNPALEPKCGKLSELNMSADDIRSLELQGFIKNAVSGDGKTWALTKRGAEMREYFLSKRSVSDKIGDWFCNHILRMRVQI